MGNAPVGVGMNDALVPGGRCGLILGQHTAEARPQDQASREEVPAVARRLHKGFRVHTRPAGFHFGGASSRTNQPVWHPAASGCVGARLQTLNPVGPTQKDRAEWKCLPKYKCWPRTHRCQWTTRHPVPRKLRLFLRPAEAKLGKRCSRPNETRRTM